MSGGANAVTAVGSRRRRGRHGCAGRRCSYGLYSYRSIRIPAPPVARRRKPCSPGRRESSPSAPRPARAETAHAGRHAPVPGGRPRVRLTTKYLDGRETRRYYRPMRRSPPPHVFVALIVGAIAISVAAILIRWADAPPLVTAAARMTIAAALVGPVGVVRARTEFRKLTLRDLGVAALSGVLLAVHFAAWITSLELTSVASSVVLVTTSPLWAALLGPLLTGDRLTRSMIVGIIFATAGGIVVGMGDFTLSNSALLGDGLALLGAIMAALYLLA